MAAKSAVAKSTGRESPSTGAGSSSDPVNGSTFAKWNEENRDHFIDAMMDTKNSAEYVLWM